MNAIYTLLNTSIKKGIFNYHPKCKTYPGALLFYVWTQAKRGQNIIIFVWIHDRKLEDIHNATNFKSGRLSVIYFGVPLMTRKFIKKDCAPLLEKLKAKLHSWSHRSVSYGGRLHLIKSVLFSLVNFWENDTVTRGAKVGRSQICTPKSKGGMGLKNIDRLNRANLLMLIRNVLAQNDSLWLLKLKAEATVVFIVGIDLDKIKITWIYDQIRDKKENV
ncbi:hypothetical protein GQ457_02G014080 [Hibiscus cannabinus]